MPLPSRTRLGSYEIIAPIGAGGMGEVYRARDTQLDRDVALKVLPAAFAADLERLTRFEREARALAALNHPNIAQVYGIVAADARQSPAIAMELVDGRTLEELATALPVDDVLSIASQIAQTAAATSMSASGVPPGAARRRQMMAAAAAPIAAPSRYTNENSAAIEARIMNITGQMIGEPGAAYQSMQRLTIFTTAKQAIHGLRAPD